MAEAGRPVGMGRGRAQGPRVSPGSLQRSSQVLLEVQRGACAAVTVKLPEQTSRYPPQGVEARQGLAALFFSH